MRRASRRFALLLSLLVGILLLVRADAEATEYIKLLGRRVPARELARKVYITDVAFDDFGVPQTREMFGVSGKGVKVCVVDTGIDPDHEQIAPRRVRFFDAVNGRTVPYDDHGHGTHVAAIIAGDGTGVQPAAFEHRGVAPRARLLVAKVLDATGTGTFAQVIAGLTWCAERPRVDVINMSLGTRGPSDGSDALSQAVDAVVRDYGKVVVVSAGNNYEALGSVGAPAAASEAITVGAVAEWSSRWTTADYSSGPYLAPFSSRGSATVRKPDVLAPGTTISSADAGTGSGYVSFSGTSMSSPFVAGVVALMLEGEPTLSVGDIKGRLQATAVDLGIPGWDPDYGYGLVDVRAALGGPPWRFPAHETVQGSVTAGGTWEYEFEVSDNADPIAATVLVTNGRWDAEREMWDPGIRAWLFYPNGEAVRFGECPFGGPADLWCGRWGRQQTMTWDTPGHPPKAGVYKVRVEIRDFAAISEATFTVDIFHG